MSIKIEITGNSIDEIADKLKALAAQLGNVAPIRGTTAAEASGETQAAPKRPRKAKEETPAEQSAEVVAQAEGEPLPTAGADTPAASSEATGAGSTVSDAPAENADLDFDKDVAPLVIKLVGAKGKPFVTELLGEFGVERASQVDEARWPELIERLNDAL